ncbi:ABC transporter substrate-binding protein [Humisphaera borealis]|uniref:Thiamine pyrimidine synthase n=1 Tax=Humisphaera borealis TaxID=2807512 RepID=A0A7M2X3I0_9BACT|nr:ABC transporter substrate-binding protein [Humisphaera borealis]
MSLQLNWIVEPQFGGFYAAGLEGGGFQKQGLDVTITPGGSGTPALQMVGSGKADFAVASADEVVKARAGGNDIVALLAVYQDCPQGLMTRASRGLTSIEGVMKADGTIAVQKGLDYWLFLEKKYGAAKGKVVPSPGGNIAQFLADEKFTQQCFVTSEPLAAKKAGVETKTFLVKEAGYNPYTTVLITRGDVVKKNPELVRKMTLACREGWEAYVADPTATNAAMLKLNPSMDAATMAESAAVQKPLIVNEATKTSGLGCMTMARWESLVQALVDLKAIDKAVPAAECFVDPKSLTAAK